MESILQQQLCSWLNYQHPTVLYRTDMAAAKRSFTQARYMKATQAVKGWPDLQVVAMRGGFGGMFLELKADGATLYLKDGTLSSDAHIQQQALVLQQLRVRGYSADFGQGFEDCIAKIDAYLRLPKAA